MKKISIILFIVCTFVFFNVTLFSSSFDYKLQDDKNDHFYGIVDGDKDNVYGIKLDVYSSTFKDNENNVSIQKYDEKFEFTVYTDKNGWFSFKKSNDNFSVSIDLDSLPGGYGVNEITRFFTKDEKSVSFKISKIKNVDVDLSKNNIKLIDENNSIVFANNTYSIEKIDFDSNSIETSNLINFNICVNVNNKYFNYIKQYDLSINNYIERERFLYRIWETFVKDNLYRDNSSGTIPLSKPNYVNKGVVSAGNFRVYYERGTSNPMDISIAQAIANEYLNIDSFFVLLIYFLNLILYLQEYLKYIFHQKVLVNMQVELAMEIYLIIDLILFTNILIWLVDPI